MWGRGACSSHNGAVVPGTCSKLCVNAKREGREFCFWLVCHSGGPRLHIYRGFRVLEKPSVERVLRMVPAVVVQVGEGRRRC